MPSQYGAQVAVTDDGDVVLTVTGELDLAVADDLVELITAAGIGARIVNLEIGDVTFIDSTGIRALVDGGRTINDWGGRLRIRSRSYQVNRVLELTGLGSTNPMFDVVPDP